MVVKLQALDLAATGSRFTALLSSRYADVNKIRGKRIAGARVSAEQIANLIDHGAVAEVHQSKVGLNAREADPLGRLPANYGLLPAKDVYWMTFTRDELTLDEIYFDVTPAGRAGPDRFVELFNQAAREGYCR
jgi:hypothetical protein